MNKFLVLLVAVVGCSSTWALQGATSKQQRHLDSIAKVLHGNFNTTGLSTIKNGVENISEELLKLGISASEVVANTPLFFDYSCLFHKGYRNFTPVLKEALDIVNQAKALKQKARNINGDKAIEKTLHNVFLKYFVKVYPLVPIHVEEVLDQFHHFNSKIDKIVNQYAFLRVQYVQRKYSNCFDTLYCFDNLRSRVSNIIFTKSYSISAKDQALNLADYLNRHGGFLKNDYNAELCAGIPYYFS